MALLLFVAVPEPAHAGPSEWLAAFDPDIRSLLLFGVFAGAVLFCVIAGAMFLSAARRSRHAARRAAASADSLEEERATFHTLLAVEPQLLLRWESGGAPQLVTATLDPATGYPDKITDLIRYDHWLTQVSAEALSELIPALLEAGESFILPLETTSGARLEAVGRAFGADAIVKIRALEGEDREVASENARRHQLNRDDSVSRGLLNAIPMPVWFRNADGKLSWVNTAYARAVDAKDAQAVCSDQIEFLSSRQRSLATSDLDDGRMHARRMHAVVAGQRRAFDAIVQPVGSASAGIAIDVAALESAQSELSKHIEEHTRTLDRIATAVAIFTPDKRLQYFNQAFTDLWGLETSWLNTGPSDGEILDRLRQDRCLPEQADYRAWRDKHLARYDGTSTHEDRWHLPDGRTIHVVANHVVGESATYLYENITEELALKSSYNALIHVQKETLDHLREGVAVFATDGRLKLYNPSFASIWKLDEAELEKEPHIDVVIGWCRDLMDDDVAWGELKKAITSIDDTRAPLEGQLNRPDGSVVAYAGMPLPDGATLLTYIDITDSKRVENALIDRNEALVAADRLKSAFISHISYELRTPLTNIIGFAELLTSPTTGELNERQKDYLGDIQTSSDSLLTIINDILDLATIDAGVLELSRSPVKAKDVIEAAVIGVRERINQAGIKLRVTVNDDAEEFVADGRRITQVLFNLLSNAVGFSEADGIVSVNCRRDGEMIAISVEDQGRGIPEDYQESAFDRFEARPQGSRHRGAGLGLTIVKNLVELHGGKVDLDSTPGTGTTVTIRLPAKPADELLAPAEEAAAIGQTAELDQPVMPDTPAAKTG